MICGGNLPDHTTIARFRGEFAGPVASFLAEVLALRARLGMGQAGGGGPGRYQDRRVGVESANRTEELRRKLPAETVAAHAAADAAEDDLFGAGRAVRGGVALAAAWAEPRAPASLL